MADTIYIRPEDLRHREHLHCTAGIRRFCQRTGLDYDRLMAGGVTTEEVIALHTAMGDEVVRNAEERRGLEQAAPAAEDKA